MRVEVECNRRAVALSGEIMPRAILALAILLTACATYAYEQPERSLPRSALESAPAVRHRRLIGPATSAQRSPLAWQDILVVARRPGGGLFAGTSPPPVAQPMTSAVPAEPEKLVVEVWITMQTDDVAKAAAAIRAQVEAAGGRVVSENVEGPERAASSAALELRVPPTSAAHVSTWLGTLGEIESRRSLASDVGKTLVDQQLELDNLEVTMKRLHKLAETEVPVKELLEIEKEMTRVRGDLERVKGEQRWLLDRVAFATFTVTLTREGGPVELSSDARIYPGPRLATLVLIDPGTRPRTRIGGGITLHVRRHLTLDLDVFPRNDGDSRAVIATVGTGLYSSYLGQGVRRYLNPYVGARVGYGYLSARSAVVLAGELGVELYKHRYLLVETAARAVVFLRENANEAALHLMVGLAIPF